MKISPEKLQKYWADTYFEISEELKSEGKIQDSFTCFVMAYSLYLKMEDAKGLRRCRKIFKIREDKENRIFYAAQWVYRNCIAKTAEEGLLDGETKEDIKSHLKRVCLEVICQSH